MKSNFIIIFIETNHSLVGFFLVRQQKQKKTLFLGCVYNRVMVRFDWVFFFET